ncbi:MAG: hypothetical protein HY360_25795 [Verrucomicrobia bacterium]|nr:hypothetical protein [Verrucomicrobiota bacterium]
MKRIFLCPLIEMRAVLLSVLALNTAAKLMALDSSDLLFHLSFEDGVNPEFARGSGAVATMPRDLDRRLVEGLFGKGYLWGGKESTIRYFTGGTGGRNCWEMYGANGNLFGDAGTLSFWFKPLPNTHNMARAFFRCDDQCLIQVARGQYMAYAFNYKSKGGGLYDQVMPPNEWHHIAITWRKDELRGFLDGAQPVVVLETGVLGKTPERFSVATEGMSWLDFQKKEFEDDTVLDELQIFRRPLTDEEVRSLYERGHVTVSHIVGVNASVVRAPERDYAAHQLTAPLTAAPVKADGDLSDWKGIPGHGGFIERRLGVLDDDPGRVYAACDARNLYLAFFCEVDASIQKDPTHVWYPTGEFRAEATERDGEVAGDDYVEFAIKSKDGHEYRFALNPRNALADSRDGNKTWNSNAQWKSRSDFKDWTAELIVPLADLGAAVGDTVDFNVTRSWKLFKSSQNTLCADARGQPAFGKLALGGAVAAAVENLGQPWRGTIEARGSLVGPAGEYTVRLRGKGHGQAFTNEAKVVVIADSGRWEGLYAPPHRLAKPGDLAAILEVLDPAGKSVLARTIPFVYPAGSAVELWNYPGWGKLDVMVTPLGGSYTNLSATVSLDQGNKTVLSAAMAGFTNPVQTVRFETGNLPMGAYTVVSRIFQHKELVTEDRQPYEKKPLPPWYHCRTGVIEQPPIPWTDVQVHAPRWWSRLLGRERKITIECLLKTVRFQNTLFPAEIMSNGQSLLSRPIGLRVRRNGRDQWLTTGDVKITSRNRRQACWEATGSDDGMRVTVRGRVEFDGFMWMDIELAGGKVDRVALEIPLRKECATLTTLSGPFVGDKPRDLPTQYGGYWFGNEKAGLQYGWEDNRDWTLAGESGKMTPANGEAVLSMPFIQKTVDLSRPRTISLGWSLTPSKPLRRDLRHIQLERGGVTYTYADYAGRTPNYPQPFESPEWYQKVRAALQRAKDPLSLFYAFGPFIWNGAPEYAEWYREWSFTPDAVKPDPDSKWLGPACHHSSGSDLLIWRLDNYVKQYPQRGIYFDCMGGGNCKNEAHGCGYVDETGVRKPINPLLAARRHYERIYNVMKAADPVYGWVRFHDWIPNMPSASFCDDNWIGEGMIGAIAGSPGKNYHTVVDIPTARLLFANEHWGHLTSWLTEMGKYGRMTRAPRADGDGDPGEWAFPPADLADHEHVAGLALLHDIWQVGGNSLELPWMWVAEIERLMRWDEPVRFVGYWELDDRLEMAGRMPEKVECSLYYRPAGLAPPNTEAVDFTKDPESWRRFVVAPKVKAQLRSAGGATTGWLILAPMNNTDEDVTVTLRPNLSKLGLKAPANGRWRDLYRAFDYSWKGPETWRVSGTDPSAPIYPFKGREDIFPIQDGAATVKIPRRNFRMLLLEEK